MPEKITAEYFTEHAGWEPTDDDLERVNCPQAGQANHRSCGWNHQKNMPVFSVGRETKQEQTP